jgi:hypothetical protein
MSRWGDAFAALSRGADTLDRMRHSDRPPPRVSQSVNSVTVPVRAEPPMAGADRTGGSWSDAEPERAPIIEYDSHNIPRAWADGFARLDRDCPPADVPRRRWLAFIDDCERFLDGGFAARAAALGWGAFDVFGCDRDRPFARIDQSGLLWLLDGGRLVALAENTARIETKAGARQIYRRRPIEQNRVLAWELADGKHRRPCSRSRR